MAATLDDLFREQSEIEVKGRTLYIRAFSDIDLQARDEFAQREQSKLRRKLQDRDSDEYLTHLDWIEAADDADLLRAAVLSYDALVFARQAASEIQPTIFPIPDEADESERDDVLRLREEEIAKTNTARDEFVTKRIEERREELKDKDLDALKKLTRTAIVNTQLWSLRNRLLEAYTIYAGVFDDAACTKRYVPTPHAALDLPPDVRQTILARYFDELERVSALDLKYFLSTGGSSDT